MIDINYKAINSFMSLVMKNKAYRIFVYLTCAVPWYAAVYKTSDTAWMNILLLTNLVLYNFDRIRTIACYRKNSKVLCNWNYMCTVYHREASK